MYVCSLYMFIYAKVTLIFRKVLCMYVLCICSYVHFLNFFVYVCSYMQKLHLRKKENVCMFDMRGGGGDIPGDQLSRPPKP
jgi:hypothetical protein